MSNMSVGQIIMDAQRIAGRVKDLELLGNALLVEAEGNNRLVESLRQFQDDIDSLNRVSNNKSNSEMVNRIQQQNATSSEILKENRELKICIEDYERTMEFIMQKYREHTTSKILESKINFKDIYNEELWLIIREQRAKIKEMAMVMQRAASVDDDVVHRDMEVMSRLRKENEVLRELLQISKQFGSASQPIRMNAHLLEEKGVQTEVTSAGAGAGAGFGAGFNSTADDSADDDLSLSGASVENVNNNSVVAMQPDAINSSNTVVTDAGTAAAAATDNKDVCKGATTSPTLGENNNVATALGTDKPTAKNNDSLNTAKDVNAGSTGVTKVANSTSKAGRPSTIITTTGKQSSTSVDPASKSVTTAAVVVELKKTAT